MRLSEIYPDGKLVWAEAVETDDLKPLGETAKLVCFLNEERVRRGRYEVFHYKLGNYWDSGPPAIDQIVEACRLLETEMEACEKVTVYCPASAMEHHRAFSALCVAAHRILVRKESAGNASRPFCGGDTTDIGFFLHSWAPRDRPKPPESLSLETCLEALELARDRGWIDVDAFDTKRYRELWQVYDLSWLVPGEVQVLGDPMSTIIDPDPSTVSHLVRPEGAADGTLSFASFFEEACVKLLVRLNMFSEPGLRESYKPDTFTKRGIGFLDASYDDVDGGVPSRSTVRKALQKCVEVGADSRAAMAFHCKAGFGRSVVVAALWTAYSHDVPGRLVFAWARICRPGSITTPQQARFLLVQSGKASIEEYMSKSDACCSSM